ncbi:MAG: sugar ABC transporter permease [Ktedonobacterales bacterium]
MAATLDQRGQAPTTRSGSTRWRALFSPWFWIAPALAFVTIFLFYPVIYTFWLSFLNPLSTQFVGVKNYQTIFTNPGLLEVLRNNILWLVVGTVGSVALGLLVAVLVDRVKFEGTAKAAIFIPMAISFVGAGVIWRFVYAYTAPGQPQIGLLNAIWGLFGGQPIAWLVNAQTNNLAMIAVYIWIWTGFCMVIISAALKGIPVELLEAARTDGASEVTIFFRITIPLISPTLAVVATTMVINLLKIFDIVYVMTGGDFGTNVIATEYVTQAFNFNNFGLSSALAVVLIVAVIPVIYFNIQRFRIQEAQR